jgi:S-adenosylmethionine:tRNA ribosyltransferase-isomerase
MQLDELYFDLPEELIAQEPARPAHQARLMVLSKDTQSIQESTFEHIADFLREDDVLVFNNSKVLPARLIGKKETGGKVELLLLKHINDDHWEALVNKGAELIGKKIIFDESFHGFIEEKHNDTFVIHFNLKGTDLLDAIFTHGQVPSPPYIKKLVAATDYQNIFADDSKLGSAAAPTAGLHFTDTVFDSLKKKGVQIEYVTLHVGLGTFQPIKTQIVENHPIHSEYYEIEPDSYQRIVEAKKQGRRIIAVGTTSCRVLETIFQSEVLNGETSIFIYPGYTFKAIDALITNFHTPHSSLLALVMALGGKEYIMKAYQHAVQNKWKFYSLGDGMLIH